MKLKSVNETIKYLAWKHAYTITQKSVIPRVRHQVYNHFNEVVLRDVYEEVAVNIEMDLK